MNIDGRTRVCGVIGKPIEHTMSPVIHNTLAKELGINLAYVPYLVREKLDDAIKGAFALNMLGLNVTVPYKSDVISSVCEIDDLAKKIGAVNTLVRMDRGFKGYNTDLMGLYRGMQSEGIAIEGEDIIILGAGGAARAVTFMCVEYGAKHVYILNRSIEKAIDIANEVNEKAGKNVVNPMALSQYSELPESKFLAIQATSVGLSPNDNDVVITDEAFYQRIHTGYDLIYCPANTKFMQLVKEQGGKSYHGLKMLLYQAIIGFEMWNQVKVSEELANKVYQKMKEEMGIEK